MTEIIVTDHGYLPTGLPSATTLVTGRPENTAGVSLPEGCSPSDLKEVMIGPVEALEGGKILVLADLVGETLFSVVAALREELRNRRIKVMTGVNMAGLMEAMFSRSVYGPGELATAVLAAGREGIRDLNCLDSKGQELEFGDGL